MIKMKLFSVINKFLCVLLFIAFAFALALAVTPGPMAYATSEELIAFESSSVEYDLEGMGFNLEEYLANDKGEVAVFAFMEYGYSEYVNVFDDYNLYFYVYNPRELDFDFDSVKNRVQFAVAYDDKGVATDYKKFSVELVKSSDTGLYLKFKVSAGLDTLHSLVVGKNERCYTVSGIELCERGELNAVEYSIATSFYFSGYAKGYARDTEAESTLECRTVEIDTIELEVKHTTYKSWNTDNVSGQEMATVYFNVPERYFNEYGNLQQIKAEWLYSVTDYIYCTNNKDLYDKFLPRLGEEVLEDTSMGYYLAGDIYYGQYGGADYVDVYNYNPSSFLFNIVSRVNSINWLMYGESSSLDDLHIKAEELLTFYENNQDKNLLSYVDESKTVITIDAGTMYDLKGLDKNHSGWEWLWEFLGFTDTVQTISPIYVVTDSDVNLSNVDFAKNLYVNENDVDDIKAKHLESGSRTVLFRFAINDFISDECEVGRHSSYNPPDIDYGGVYRTKLPLYQDFDIIWLGFQKNGKLTIVPAVSNPTTVIGDTEPPKDNSDKDWSGDALLDSLFPDDSGCASLEELLIGIAIAIAIILVVCFLVWILSLINKHLESRRINKIYKAVKGSSSKKSRNKNSYRKNQPNWVKPPKV